MGQIHRQVKAAIDEPGRLFLSNRVDGRFITPRDIRHVLRIVEGQGE